MPNTSCQPRPLFAAPSVRAVIARRRTATASRMRRLLRSGGRKPAPVPENDREMLLPLNPRIDRDQHSGQFRPGTVRRGRPSRGRPRSHGFGSASRIRARLHESAMPARSRGPLCLFCQVTPAHAESIGMPRIAMGFWVNAKFAGVRYGCYCGCWAYDGAAEA